MLHVAGVPRLMFPLAVLLSCMGWAGLLATADLFTPLGYGLFAAALCALPAIVLISSRHALASSPAPHPVRGSVPRLRRRA